MRRKLCAEQRHSSQAKVSYVLRPGWLLEGGLIALRNTVTLEHATSIPTLGYPGRDAIAQRAGPGPPARSAQLPKYLGA
jgi:hypothetical protein